MLVCALGLAGFYVAGVGVAGDIVATLVVFGFHDCPFRRARALDGKGTPHQNGGWRDDLPPDGPKRAHKGKGIPCYTHTSPVVGWCEQYKIPLPSCAFRSRQIELFLRATLEK